METSRGRRSLATSGSRPLSAVEEQPLRKLIQEMPYERPLAAGRYVYSQDGAPTGAVESWHLSAAMEGYRFLRVDYDASEASGDHALYHLVLDAKERPQRLKFRFFRRGLQISGDLLFAEDSALLSRTINSRQLDAETAFSPATAFWFPASSGLSLLGDGPAESAALTLKPDDNFALKPTTLALSEGAPQTIFLMGRQIETTLVSARWDHEQQTIWFDEYHWPVRVERESLAALESRYVRYTV